MEHKNRGKQHRFNKKHFQNKAKVVQKPEEKAGTPNTTTSTQKLESNWGRYDESAEDEWEPRQLNDSTNFALLSQAPISQGGLFQFKSDKNLESEYDFDSLRNNKIFSLDLDVLVSSLSTIPFHDRCGLDTSYLTESDLQANNKVAEDNKVQYESKLKIMSITTDIHKQSITKNDVPTKVDVQESSANTLGEDHSINKDKDVHNINTNQEDLEEWLEDVLDI